MKKLVVISLALASVFISGAARGQGLIGLTFLPGESTVTVISIDPATGTQTPLLPTTATGIAGGHIALDSVNRRLFFEDASSLYTADLAHGTVSQVPLVLCCPPLEFAQGGAAPCPS